MQRLEQYLRNRSWATEADYNCCPMELKRLVQSFTYRIEPKPEGGFISRVAYPTVPALEAPTREELQQKIQAKLLAQLGENFPGLKLPSQANQQVKWEVPIESK